MTMGTAIGLVCMRLDIRDESRPERLPAGFDRGRRKMLREDAISAIFDFADACDEGPIGIHEWRWRSTALPPLAGVRASTEGGRREARRGGRSRRSRRRRRAPTAADGGAGAPPV